MYTASSHFICTDFQDHICCGCFPRIQPSQVWAQIQTLTFLMQLLLFQSILFFSHLPFTFPTVLCHLLRPLSHPSHFRKIASLTPSSLTSTLKFVFIHNHLHSHKYIFSYIYSSQRTSQTSLFLCTIPPHFQVFGNKINTLIGFDERIC